MMLDPDGLKAAHARFWQKDTSIHDNLGPAIEAYLSAIASKGEEAEPVGDRELRELLDAALIEIDEAADKMHVLGLNHPGEHIGDRAGEAYRRMSGEDKLFMKKLHERFNAAASNIRGALSALSKVSSAIGNQDAIWNEAVQKCAEEASRTVGNHFDRIDTIKALHSLKRSPKEGEPA